ncbi:Enoyl-CoA-hydratase [Streptomyces sp. RB5]|uniref:Enoyl-CoA-hydratase n=1 Tax=Streptomyces smaragdinus TaxID=2585196 RepID=A0A7K0CC28_9ACTN|nr:enoyl-CoA-hydratase DpgB [Streptomyces smaragdinus]MQY11001.1 Enoyl-CoA-hydratase [Streptomyces smaragdinus]
MDTNGYDGPTLTVDGSSPVTATTVKELVALCDRVEDGDGTTVLIHVTGAPTVPVFPPDAGIALVTKWERALRRLERLPAATVAVAHGSCGGPALDAFLTADLRIAAPGTVFWATPDAGSPWPGMAAFRLTRLVGLPHARRAVLLGEPITAAEAERTGLVDRITDDAVPSALPGGTAGAELAIARQLLFDAQSTSFEDALGAHLAACDRTLRQAATGPRPNPEQEPVR